MTHCFPPKVCLLNRALEVIDPNGHVEGKLLSYLVGVRDARELASLLFNNRAHRYYSTLVELSTVRSLELRANSQFARRRYTQVWASGREQGLPEKFLSDVLTTLAVYESCLDRGWASRTFRMIATRGVRVALDKLIESGERRNGYALLKGRGLLGFSFESLVDRYPCYFSITSKC